MKGKSVHLLVDLMSILHLDNAPNALVPVSKTQWLGLYKKWPQHCYGNPEAAVENHPYGNTPNSISAYRVDISGMLGLPGIREGNLVLKDQWMVLFGDAKYREFCFGGESRSVTSKKSAAASIPLKRYDNWLLTLKGYDNWLLTLQYLSQMSLVESGLVSLDLFQETVTSEGITEKAHGYCLMHAIATGMVEEVQFDGKIWIVLKEGNLT